MKTERKLFLSTTTGPEEQAHHKGKTQYGMSYYKGVDDLLGYNIQSKQEETHMFPIRGHNPGLKYADFGCKVTKSSEVLKCMKGSSDCLNTNKIAKKLSSFIEQQRTSI